MYKHIGKKLKVFAEIWCAVAAIGAILSALMLYLVMKPALDLLYCILIGVGGVIIAVLSSWGIWALGDIHVKLERLEDKLIPKPNYMSYLEENQALRGACEICGKTTDLINAKIVDSLGTRYRKVCRDCFAANGAEER